MSLSAIHVISVLLVCVSLTACGSKSDSEGSKPPRKTSTPTTPDDGGSTTPPDNGGGTTPPDNGGGTTPPDNGGGTTPPDNGGGTTPPDDGGGSTPPAFTCAEGYVLIAANSALSTDRFCVAKYEMKTSASTFELDGKTYPQPVSAAYSAPNASTVAGHFYGGNKDGANFSMHRSEALAACRSLGENYDLITNSQWMAVAREIESEASNWSGGVIGKGAISRGNSTGSVQPEGDDSQPCTNTGTSCDLSTWNLNRRVHKLHSNGALIWDFAGNTKEWIFDGTPDPTQRHIYSEFMYKLFSWSPYGPMNDYSNATAYPDFDRNNGGHLGYFNIWSTNAIYTRGGNYTNAVTDGAAPGIYTMQQVSLNYNPSGGKYQGQWGIGFRCVHR